MVDKTKIRISHNKTPLIIAIFFFILLILIILFLRQQLQQPVQNNKLECQTDADCVKVQTTCCSCNSGGEDKCVPVKNYSEYKPKNCPPGNRLICTALYNCKIGKCECAKGKCIEEIKENE